MSLIISPAGFVEPTALSGPKSFYPPQTYSAVEIETITRTNFANSTAPKHGLVPNPPDLSISLHIIYKQGQPLGNCFARSGLPAEGVASFG
jgi:hypothetical protein